MHKYIVALSLLLLIVGCETPGSKTLSLNPNLDFQTEKQALGFLILTTKDNIKKPRLDDRSIEVPIASKITLVAELFREGLTAQGWTVIAAGSPLLPVPNPKNVTLGVNEFLVYLVPNVTHDTAHVRLTLTLSYQKDGKTITRTFNKRASENFPVKAVNEDVKKFAEIALSEFVVSILEKNHLLESN